MTQSNSTVWCVNAGKGNSAHKAEDVQRLFLEKSYIAIGWAELGNLRELVHGLEQLKSRIKELWHGDKASVDQTAAIINRFASDMQIDDIVVYLPGRSSLVYIGRIAGPYIYNPRLDEYYPHVRPVVWVTELMKNDLPDEAKATFLTPMSVFRVSKGREVFASAVLNKGQSSR
jgi:restriction system protein